MSNAYYSSGERDEETGERVRPKIWDDTIAQPAEKVPAPQAEEKDSHTPKVTKSFPKEFDDYYYIDHRDKYLRSDTKYWDWEYFRKYSDEVYSAYKNMAQHFYTAMKPVELGALPFFVDLSVAPDADLTVEDLVNAERQLIKQFGRTNRTIQAKINKHSALARLQMYGAKTWVMYLALQGKIPVKDNLNLKKIYSTMDKDNIEHVLKVFRYAKLLKYYFKKYVSVATLGENKVTANEVYGGLTFNSVYDEVIKSIDGATIEDCREIEKEFTSKLSLAAETDDRIKSLFKFYNLYSEMKFVIQKTIIKNHMWKNGSREWFIFSGDENEFVGKDYYQECKNYLSACEKLRDKLSEDDIPFYKDVCKICDELNETILNASDSYKESHLLKYDEPN